MSGAGANAEKQGGKAYLSLLNGQPKRRGAGEGGPILYSWEELPAWARDNPLIDGAYRDHHPSREGWQRCVRSVFELHNDTVNIWTHMLGVLFFAPRFAYTIAVRLPQWCRSSPWGGPGAWDYAVWGAFAASAVLCLAFSTAFHTLMNHSAVGFRRFIVLDYTGIVLLIWGSHVICSYYLFYCSAIAHSSLMVFITVLGAAVLVVMLVPRYMAPDYRVFRAVLFGGMGATGLLPIGWYAATRLGRGCAECDAMVRSLACMLCSYGVGVVAYACRFPESARFSTRGQFNYFFASHHWLHVGVLFGVAFHAEYATLAVQHVHSPGFTCPA